MANVMKYKHLQELAKKRGRIYVAQNVYDRYKNYREGDIVAGDVLHPISVEPEQIGAMTTTYGLDREAAALFAKASSGWIKPRIMAESAKAHETAGKLNMESMNHELFAEFYDLGLGTKN
jgi:hypothetical protein